MTVVVSPHYALIGRVLELAPLEVGVRETGGANRGGAIAVPYRPRIELYQATAGGKPGDPYCVAGIYFCFVQAARDLGVINPMPRTMGALRLYELAAPHFRLPPWTNGGQAPPQPGAIGVHQSASKPGKGHVALVVAVEGVVIHTIEWNTNPAGSRDGDGVYRRTRPPEYFDRGYVDFGREWKGAAA